MSGARQQALVVVLTALDLEYRAVRELLTDLRPVPHPTGTIFETGIPVPAGSAPVRIALVLTGQGNQTAAVLAERANGVFRPDAMLVVGIAGTLHDDIALGDVVVATRVYDYHGGTEEGEEFRPRPRLWNAPHHLEQLARHVARTERQPSFQVHFRPVAAGETLLNSRTSPLALRLRDHYSDTAAVEMESAGAAHAGHLGGSVPVLTIRGISDRADGRKAASDAAGWQLIAAAHAAAFAMALCGRVPEALRGPTQPDPAPQESRIVLNMEVSGGGTGFQAAGDQYINQDFRRAPD